MKHINKIIAIAACLLLSAAFAQVPPVPPADIPAPGSGPLDPIPETGGMKCTTQMNDRQRQCPAAGGCTKVSWRGPRCTASTNPADLCAESWDLSGTTPVIVAVGYCSGSTCHLTGEVTVETGVATIVCTATPGGPEEPDEPDLP